MKYPGFVGPSYTAYSVSIDAQQSMNLYPEIDESGAGKNVAALYGRPGLTAPFTTLATSPVRALWAGGDPVAGPERLFAVGGSKLIEISSIGGLTVRGDVGTDASNTPATILPNGNQLGCVSAGNFYLDNGSGPVQPTFANNNGTCIVIGVGPFLVTWTAGAQFDSSMTAINIGGVGCAVIAYISEQYIYVTGAIAAGTYPFSYTLGVTAQSGTFLDGYYIVAKPSSKVFQISALFDGTSWNALDYGVKEGYPDNIASVWADHEQLWLFGTETTEVWQNTGRLSFPFERIPGAFLNHGLRAQYSIARLGSFGLAWIGGDQRGVPGAFVANGYVPKRISTHAIEKAWESYSKITDAIGFSHLWRGHMFWSIHFPTADKTWVYDATSGYWHERGWWNGASNGRERGRCHAYVFGKHLVGDYSSGAVYQMSDTAYTDNGTAIHWNRTAPYVNKPDGDGNPDRGNNLYQFFSQFVLSMETGMGNSPVITLKWSNDGGKNYSPAVTTTAGVLNDTLARVAFRRLGKTKLPGMRIFDVSGSDASKVAIIGAEIE
jgi:hypothetical protein